MQYITPGEATHLAYITTDLGTFFHARTIFAYCYQVRRDSGGAMSEIHWAINCAAAACYTAGRIDGIRAERERRRAHKSR